MLSIIFFWGGGGGGGGGRGASELDYVPDHLHVLEMHAHGLSKQVRTAPIKLEHQNNEHYVSIIHVGSF